MGSSQIADALVIGGGPAGLAAALTLSRLQHTVVLFDSGVYRNAPASHMHNLPTWDHRDPAEFRESARKDLVTRYNTTSFVDSTVQTVSKQDDGTFVTTVESGAKYYGKKLVLASGSEDIFPDIPGYADLWGKLIFHCLFCHGYEERGADEAGILAVDDLADVPHAVGVSGMAQRLAKKVTIYTHGNEALAAELQTPAQSKGLSVDPRSIASVGRASSSSSGGGIELRFADGSAKVLGFVSHKPRTRVRGPLAAQLGLELTPTGDIKTSQPFNEASVPGVFAAGDCGSMLKIASGALSSGLLAANGAAIQVEQGV